MHSFLIRVLLLGGQYALVAPAAFGQGTSPGQLLIRGRVIGPDDIGLANAPVMLLGTDLKTRTTREGNYQLALPDSVRRKLPDKPLYLAVNIPNYDAEPIVLAQRPAELPAGPVLDVPESAVFVWGRLLKGMPQKPTLPELPWPPPHWSAIYQFDKKYLNGTAHLSDAADRLVNTLKQAGKAQHLDGYSGFVYYQVPRGFALATELEQIDELGKPMPGIARWNYNMKPTGGFVQWMKNLLVQNTGRYRVLVFIVTPQEFGQGQKLSIKTQKEAQQWMESGFRGLPASVGALPCPPGCKVTALVYEFESTETATTLLDRSATTGQHHLMQAGVSLSAP